MKWGDVKEVVNCTPHEVTVMVGDTMKRIPPSGRIVRTSLRCDPCGEIEGMPVVRCNESEPRNMPAPKDGVVYLVSSVVAKAVRRKDVLSPDTFDEGVIRDGNGYIIAVKRLQYFGERR